MQHLEPAAQVAIKQRSLEDLLWHIGRLRPERLLEPIYGPSWGYRYRARLSVRVVPKKGGVLVGFHERRSSYVADMRECHVLPPHVSALLVPLRDLIASLSVPDRYPQIEVAIGDRQTALVLRHLVPIEPADREKLLAFAACHGITWWPQPKGPDTVHALNPKDETELAYSLPEFGLRMPFRPTDFTQVNHPMNRVMVSRALRLLAIEPGDRVADLFCGLGNFTLPMALAAREVLGVEGSPVLTARAQAAAQAQGLARRAQFVTLNLFDVNDEWLAGLGAFDRMLIDPPREGAEAVARALCSPRVSRPRRLVYISCDPATLARDAAILVHQGGWKLRAAGVLNMFPHTGHVESMAVFE
jgi:23S rRNA (uracil1939-C5)-methyltransferase